MLIVVDTDKCQGHALCSAYAPDLLAASEEDGHAVVLRADVPPQLEAQAKRAQLGCPEQAITLR